LITNHATKNYFHSFLYAAKKKYIGRILTLIVLIFTQIHCAQHDNKVIDAPLVGQSIKGLNYSSMIETLCVRLFNRFNPSETLRPKVYLTSADIDQTKISDLHRMIIHDLSQSMQKEHFVVNIPTILLDSTQMSSTECESRYTALNNDILLVLDIQNCKTSSSCVRIVLKISDQNQTFTEMCHLALNPELTRKKSDMYPIPTRTGHMKKPFRNLEQASSYVVKNMYCLINKLLLPIDRKRLILAKSDNTSKDVIEAMNSQWQAVLDPKNIAKTVIPIDNYDDQFIIRDLKILESIPKDIQFLIAMDSMEINPGKYRIRADALALTQLAFQLDSLSSVTMGKSIPGCRFQVYTYTRSKEQRLVGESTGKCDQSLSQNLWPYSAKIRAERLAKEALSVKLRTFLRNAYLYNDLSYHEAVLDEKIGLFMKNAFLEWERFDEHTCQATARYAIHKRDLPFDISPEPVYLMNRLNQMIQSTLLDKKIASHIAQCFVVDGHISRKQCKTDQTSKASNPQMTCIYEYLLIIGYNNQSIFSTHGNIQRNGKSIRKSQEQTVNALFDMLQPVLLDFSMAVARKLNPDQLREKLRSLDGQFELKRDINAIIDLLY